MDIQSEKCKKLNSANYLNKQESGKKPALP
jgi:hypothetical protein